MKSYVPTMSRLVVENWELVLTAFKYEKEVLKKA